MGHGLVHTKGEMGHITGGPENCSSASTNSTLYIMEIVEPFLISLCDIKINIRPLVLFKPYSWITSFSVQQINVFFAPSNLAKKILEAKLS